MQGRRVEWPGWDSLPYEPGDYFKDGNGHWRGVVPNGLYCNLAGHTVTEHEDGTITVSPSIKVWGGADGEEWHGFLERGVWWEC
jgi:hypothetical protein